MNNPKLLSTVFVVVIFTIVSFVSESNAQKTTGYHLLNKIEVGGEGGWDGLIADPKAHRL